jgi:hypothetical protein
MKKILILTFACLFFVACACAVFGNATDELHIGVALTTGERTILPERQRDRNDYSQTTTITVERDAIVWEKTSSGHRLRRTAPLRKESKLSPADKRNLLKLIKSNNLFVTDSISLPYDDSNFRFFRISVALTLGRKKGAIDISGPRAAVQVREEKLYQNTLSLVKELYRIINSQDKDVDFAEFEELIHKPIER